MSERTETFITLAILNSDDSFGSLPAIIFLIPASDIPTSLAKSISLTPVSFNHRCILLPFTNLQIILIRLTFINLT